MSDLVHEYIDIVFDGPPGPVAGRFVEVVDPGGASISVGEWRDTDPFWRLRLRPEVFRPFATETNVTEGPAEIADSEALVRVASDLAAENKRLAAALKPFADKGAELIRKRGPAITLQDAHPVSIRDLVRADGAMRNAG